MDRTQFIKNRRQISETRYDTLHAVAYDENWGTIHPSHQTMLAKLLERCPSGGLILDAACGTGKYWPSILASGRQVYGIDQSRAMLAQAKAKFPQVPTEKLGVQELTASSEYDAAICMDAMENVFPEDWPLVLANFHHALKPDGWLYFTVELPGSEDLEGALEQGLAQGYPVVAGEFAHEGSYHYYPTREKVRDWVLEAGFQISEELEGDYYLHILAHRN